MRSILKEKEHLSRQLRGIRDQGQRLLMINFDEEGIQKAIYAMYGQSK